MSHCRSSLRPFVVAVLLASLVSTAIAEVLTVVEPCPACPSSIKPHPITVTEQYQTVSTCTPTQTCDSCSTEYPFTDYVYVSTVIPQAGGKSCTVTKTDQKVTVSQLKTTSTAYVPAPTKWANSTKTTSKVGHVEVVKIDYIVPYVEIGPSCIPGYGGSGLCSSCAPQKDGSQTQVVEVIECRGNKTCSTYAETWVNKPTTPITQIATETVTSVATCPTNGVYTITITDDHYTTTTVKNAPTKVTAVTTITKTVTVTTTCDTVTGPAPTAPPATVTPTHPPVVSTCAKFVIGAQLERKKHHKKGLGFIGFTGSDASVVESQDDAATFYLSGGSLFTEGKYVGSSSAHKYAILERLSSKPSVSKTWTAPIGGLVEFSNTKFTFWYGKAAFCVSSDNTVFGEYTSQPPFTCKQLNLYPQCVEYVAPTVTVSPTPKPTGSSPGGSVPTTGPPGTTTHPGQSTPTKPASTPTKPESTPTKPGTPLPPKSTKPGHPSNTPNPSSEPSSDVSSDPDQPPELYVRATSIPRPAFGDSKLVRRGGILRSPQRNKA
ncbi:MAG: hypothetical protein M4579_001096 [Chaenotheca gracillima]|nr:MAG: hypothetical protein M4579_001096 [Chaenotheca gracillima]